MDKVPSLGRSIADVLVPSFQTYAPMLAANAEAIKSTPKETFSYGPHPRHELDVYQPAGVNVDTAPIFVWAYGGGLFRGDKVLGDEDVPGGLAYANVCHFFASRGYIAIAINYRLVLSHDAHFPSGGEDYSLAVKWIAEKYAGKPHDLFLAGNSAGGIHLSTFMFHPQFKDIIEQVTTKSNGVRLRGVSFVSVPYDFVNAAPQREMILKTYYNDEIAKNCPASLFENLSDEHWAIFEQANVQFRVLSFEFDPDDELEEPQAKFLELWNKKRGGKQLTVFYGKGHNHISHFLALGTGIEREEAWGVDLEKWMQSLRG